MSKDTKTKEEILKPFVYEDEERVEPIVYVSKALEAMDEYAAQESEIKSRERAIALFKWYAAKMVGFIEYIKDIRPTVTSNEIEEKLKEFEGQSFDNLYNLFLQQTDK